MASMTSEALRKFSEYMQGLAEEDPGQFRDVMAMIWPFVQHRDLLAGMAYGWRLPSVAYTNINDYIDRIESRYGFSDPQCYAEIADIIACKRTDYNFEIKGVSSREIDNFFLFASVSNPTLRVIDLYNLGIVGRLREELQAKPEETVVEAYMRVIGNITGLQAVAAIFDTLHKYEIEYLDEWAKEHPEEWEEGDELGTYVIDFGPGSVRGE